MASLMFEPSADRALTALESDPVRAALLVRIEMALTALSDDPGDRRCRRRAYRDGVWGIPVRSGSEDWLILWLQGGANREVFVAYVGPDL
jgi:hypothetical protein